MAPTVVPGTSDAVFVITGANRGLGIEHVKQFLEKTKVKIVATARQPSKADELNELVKQYSDRLSIIELDTSSEKSIEAASQQVAKLHPEGVDLVLNNAGTQEPISRAIETSGSEYTRVLNINVVGPFLVTKYFLSLLKKKQTRVVVNTSSICGSISANFKGDFGGYLLPYNSSKAAINMQTAVLANDLKEEGFTFLALHPGWVQTDMGRAAEGTLGGKAPLDPESSIAGQQKVIMGLTRYQNGQYLDYQGKKMDY
ncbi:hypothetical protein ABBQ32_004825 [Trebouxia sp. C0010 RCD-2024]